MKDKPLNRFIIKTLGCKVNQVESETIISDLERKGWCNESSDHPADVCIINTCTVTGKAAMQSRQAVRQCIRSHPGALIVVTGCHAQTDPEDIQRIKGVHHIIGNSHKDNITDVIIAAGRQSAVSPRSDVHVHEMVVACGDISQNREFFPLSTGIADNRTRPFIKIQDGCNTFCTYCIVPFARGRSRSMPESRVLARINQIHQAGYHEGVLTGIHLGTYGEDLCPPTTLEKLLKKIIAGTALSRIRLSSIEPKELSLDIVRMVANSPRLCRHFHVPLQSGDNGILEKMNRPYTREVYKRLILDIRSHIPDCGIGADVLVGFPGETQEAFQNTVDLISELPITYLHVFPFSPRKRTAAYRFPGRVLPEITKNRCRDLRMLGYRKKKEFYESLKGKTVGVIPGEKQSDGRFKGVTSHYVPVVINGDCNPNAGILAVEIKRIVRGDHKDANLYCEGDISSQ